MNTIGKDGMGSYCEHCGGALAAEAQVCKKCGHPGVPETLVTAETPSLASPPGDSSRPTIPDTNIALGDGERVWKRYVVTYLPELSLLGIRISRATGTGTLYVTNARVLFHATYRRRGGKHSTLLQETQVEHVTGVSAFVARRFSLLALFIVILLGLAGLALVSEGST